MATVYCNLSNHRLSLTVCVTSEVIDCGSGGNCAAHRASRPLCSHIAADLSYIWGEHLRKINGGVVLPSPTEMAG